MNKSRNEAKSSRKATFSHRRCLTEGLEIRWLRSLKIWKYRFCLNADDSGSIRLILGFGGRVSRRRSEEASVCSVKKEYRIETRVVRKEC